MLSNFDSTTLQLVLSGMQVLVLFVGGVVAIVTFRRDHSLKRTEWLERLHDKFYVSDTYKEIRQILDSENLDNFSDLKKSIASSECSQEEEQLSDYLNFFHFITVIWKRGELSEKEIKMLFNYYLNLLVRHDFIVTYMKEEGFELLLGMLKKFGYIESY